jgi:hypothetical protein
MSAITNLLKSTAAVGAVALGLCFAVTPASAMNGAEFSKACAKKSNCVPAGGTDGGYIVHDDGSFTVVTCTKTNCTASKQDRQIKFDKTLGFGNTPGNDRMAPVSSKKQLDAGQRMPGQIKVDTPKPVKLETPKVSAPAGNAAKDVKINTIR